MYFSFLITKASIKFYQRLENNMATKDKVLNVFKSTAKPLRPGEIAEQTGVESKEVSKIIKELREEGKVYSPKRCYYALK